MNINLSLEKFSEIANNLEYLSGENLTKNSQIVHLSIEDCRTALILKENLNQLKLAYSRNEKKLTSAIKKVKKESRKFCSREDRKIINSGIRSIMTPVSKSELVDCLVSCLDKLMPEKFEQPVDKQLLKELWNLYVQWKTDLSLSLPPNKKMNRISQEINRKFEKLEESGLLIDCTREFLHEKIKEKEQLKESEVNLIHNIIKNHLIPIEHKETLKIFKPKKVYNKISEEVFDLLNSISKIGEYNEIEKELNEISDLYSLTTFKIEELPSYLIMKIFVNGSKIDNLALTNKKMNSLFGKEKRVNHPYININLLNEGKKISDIFNKKLDFISFITGFGISLKTINFSNCKWVTNEIIEKISVDCPNLQILNLTGCTQLKDSVGENLEKLTNLSHLDLTKCSGLTNEIGKHLEKLTKLEHLSLEEGYGPYLEKLTNLTHLNLNSCWHLGNEIGESLEKLTKLEHLSLIGGHKITDEIGSYLKKLTGLSYLELQSSKITDKIGKHLEELTGLRYLNLRYSTRLTDRIGKYLETLTNLTHLDLTYCWGLTDEIGKYLETLTELRYLNLKYCKKFTDRIGKYFEKLTNLTHLDLSDCSGLTDDIRKHLGKLTELRFLDLRGCKGFTYRVEKHFNSPYALRP